jgi:hypothetical protein
VESSELNLKSVERRVRYTVKGLALISLRNPRGRSRVPYTHSRFFFFPVHARKYRRFRHQLPPRKTKLACTRIRTFHPLFNYQLLLRTKPTRVCAMSTLSRAHTRVMTIILYV